MTLTEALSPYTITGADGALPVTSDHVEIEYHVIAGKSRWSSIVLEIGDDLYIKIGHQRGVDQSICIEVEGGPDYKPGVSSIDITPIVAKDLATCLVWAAHQKDVQLV